MALSPFPQSTSGSQQQRSHSQPDRVASRETFLWRHKLDLEEQAFDLIARINALQDKLLMIGDRKQTLKKELVILQDKLKVHPVIAVLVRRPQPDLRLFEAQVRRLVEEEEKTKADLFLANHTLDSLNAKIANLEQELSLL